MPRAPFLSGGIDASFRVGSALSALRLWNPAAARSSGVPTAPWLRSVAQRDKAVNETVNNAAVTTILVLRSERQSRQARACSRPRVSRHSRAANVTRIAAADTASDCMTGPSELVRAGVGQTLHDRPPIVVPETHQ